ncbi:hypothetical protein D3C81_2177290 [compost metagenome]
MTILFEGLVVVKHGSRGLSIEVIIKLHAINIIVGNHLRHDAGDPVPHLRDTWIEHKSVACGADPVGV